jgi:hypothetical protein
LKEADAKYGGTQHLGPCAATIEETIPCLNQSQADCWLRASIDPNSSLGRSTALAQCMTGDAFFGKRGLEPQCPFGLYGYEQAAKRSAPLNHIKNRRLSGRMLCHCAGEWSA